MSFSKSGIYFYNDAFENETMKSHADDKNPDNFSSSFHFFAIWETLPRQMPKKEI